MTSKNICDGEKCSNFAKPKKPPRKCTTRPLEGLLSGFSRSCRRGALWQRCCTHITRRGVAVRFQLGVLVSTAAFSTQQAERRKGQKAKQNRASPRSRGFAYCGAPPLRCNIHLFCSRKFSSWGGGGLVGGTAGVEGWGGLQLLGNHTHQAPQQAALLKTGRSLSVACSRSH